VERAWFYAQINAKSFTESVVYDSDVLTQIDLYEFVQSQQYTPIHKIILGLSKLQLSQYLETSTDGINTPDGAGHTPLFWASAKGNNAAVRLLLDYGADPNMGGRIMQTPLHIARTSQVVRSLLDYGADTEARDTSGRTPLHSYSYRHTAAAPSVIEEIVAGGAYINAKTTAGHTALHYAAAFGNTNLIPVLFENGISLDETKISGDTALALAVRHNQVDAIKLLLQSSANVGVHNEQGQSVVHIGACFGQVGTLEALATCDLTDLSLTTKDKRRFSPLDYFENRQVRSLELEAAFAKLVACFSAPGDDQNGVVENVQLDEITGMDEVRPMPGAF
jgi:ankyrin repeat protein